MNTPGTNVQVVLCRGMVFFNRGPVAVLPTAKTGRSFQAKIKTGTTVTW